MKQEKTKKNKLWLWILIAVLALVVVGGVVAALLLPGLSGANEPQAEAKLYWNIDRGQWLEEETGLSARTKGEDGFYHISYLVDGEIKDVKVTDDKQLVNYLDTVDAVCLVFDKDRIVVDAVAPTEYFTVVAKDAYVKRQLGDVLELNSSIAMNGMEFKLNMVPGVGPFDVKETSANPGAVVEPQWLDQATAYSDLEGNLVAVYITGNVAIDAECAWRMERFYSGGKTTRVPDENGIYTYDFAIDGKVQQRYCRDEKVANSLDSREHQNAAFALEYDEDGFIIDYEELYMGLVGYELCKGFNVDYIDNTTISASVHTPGTNAGASVEFTYDETCKIYNVCNGNCQHDHFGEEVSGLQMGDKINVYTDLDGKPIQIWISTRTVDVPMYYNMSRKYDNVTKTSTREPDENGYYVYEMAVNGGVKTLRTKSKKIADQVDSVGNYCMGLKVEGTIIKQWYASSCVSGRGVFCSGTHYVSSMTGSILSIINSEDETDNLTAIMAADCKIVNVSSIYGLKIGAKTDVREYDQITAFRNQRGELTHIFITKRYMKGHTFAYNMTRNWDSTKLCSTKTPDEKGYYYFDLAINGSVKTYKTNKKEMADFIDQQYRPVLGVKVSGDTIKSVCTAVSTIPYGSKYFNGARIRNITDGQVSGFYMSNGEQIDYAFTYGITSRTKAYNVSDAYSKQPGEKTSLKKDDEIQGVLDAKTDEIVYAAVINRKTSSPIYYHTERFYSSTTGSTRKLDENGYYVYKLVLNGKIKEFKTKDKAVADSVDKQTMGFGLILKKDSNIIERCISSSNTSYYFNTVANSDVTSIKGNKVEYRRCRLAASNYGAEGVFYKDKNTIIVDVSSYAENYGAVTKLSVGDRVVGYASNDGITDYIFITKKAVRDEGVFDYCSHCKQTVFWDAYSEYFLADAHYYLPADTTRTSTLRLGILSDEEKYDSVFDLNGHTLYGATSTMTINDHITIIDSVGGGKLANGTGTVYDNVNQGGNVYVSEGASLTLESGSIVNGTASPIGMGGNIAVNNGTVNIKGGTISGGIACLGTAIYHSGTKGGINISGGKIDGTVYAENSGKITVSGKPVIKTLLVEAGQKIKLGDLKSGASITVKADGVFTTASDNIETYKKYFKVADPADQIVVEKGALKYINNSGAVTGGASSANDDLVLNASNEGMCNVCGQVVTWIPVTNGGVIGNQAPYLSDNTTDNPNFDADKFTVTGSEKYHFYLAEDVTSAAKEFLYAYKGNRTCFHLNNKTLTLNGGIYIGNGATVSVFGNGKVHRLAASNGNKAASSTFEIDTGTLNVYGGTYTGDLVFLKSGSANAKVTVALNADVQTVSNVNNGKLTLAGAAKIANINLADSAALIVHKTFSGEAILKVNDGLVNNMVPEHNAEVLGNYTGKITYADLRSVIYKDGRLVVSGQAPSVNTPLNLDANSKDYCYVCGERVTWIPLHNGESVGMKDIDHGGAGIKYHYYLADDDMTSANGDFIYTKNGAQVCLHLNGKSANIKGGIYAGHASPGGSGVVNIVGEGTLNHLGTDMSGKAQTNMFFLETGIIKLYGGTYETNYNFIDTHAAKANFSILEDADVNETVNVTQGNLFIGGKANIEKVTVTGGKVTVNDGFTGSAMVDFSAAMVDAQTGMINRDNAATTGTFKDGAVFTSAGKVIKAVQNDTALVVTPDTVTPPTITDDPIGIVVVDRNADLVLDANNKGKCHVCDEEVTWVPLTEGMELGASFTAGEKYHYYVDGPATDVTVGAHARGFLMRVGSSASICLHLNNHNMVSPGTIWMTAGAKVNIMGKGTVTYTAAAPSSDNVNVAFFYAERSTVTLYGGNYELSGAAATNNYPIYLVKSNRQNLTVTDTAKVNGTVDCSMFTNALTLDGSSYIKELIVNDSTYAQPTAYFTVKPTFTGTVNLVTFSKGFTNGVTTIGKSEGFTGTINTAEGALIAKDGILVLAPGPNSDLVLDADNKGMCNVCGEEVTWVPLTAGMNLGTSFTKGEKYHYYVVGDETDVTVGAHTRGTLAFINTGATMCLHLNNHNMVSPGAFYLGTGAKLNIMGNGTVTYTGTAPSSMDKNCAFINTSRSVVTLYGGTYNVAETALTENKPIYDTDSDRQNLTVCGNATINGIVDCGLFTNKLVVDGNSYIKELIVNDSTDAQQSATFTVNPTFVGTISKLSFTKGGADGAMVIGKCAGLSGTILTADGRTVIAKDGALFIEKGINSPLALDGENKGMCNVCNEVVTWVPLTAGMELGTTFTKNAKYHYYVDGPDTDVTVGAHTRGTLAYFNVTATMCLHLNNHNLVSPGAFYLGTGAKLNIMGNGTVTYTGTAPSSSNVNHAFIYSDRSVVTLYGGTYTTSDAAATANLPIYYAKGNRQNLTVCGNANIQGVIDCSKYTNALTLDGTCYIKELIINDSNDAGNGTAHFTVNSTFMGTVEKLSFAKGGAEGAMYLGKGSAFTGTITTADGKSVVADNGVLKIVS